MSRETLKAEALKRANVLNASAAWGSDGDAHLLIALVRYVEELEARLRRRDAMDTLLQIDGELYGKDGAAQTQDG